MRKMVTVYKSLQRCFGIVFTDTYSTKSYAINFVF